MTIYLTQSILHQQFPSVLGLKHTEFGLRNMFTVRKSGFVQILCGNYHRVTAPGNEQDKISFHSSLNENIPWVFLQQMCNIIQTDINKISDEVQPIKQKSKQVDCRVFSIAFAATLATGDNPALVIHEQTLLRFYLNKFWN